MKETGCTYRMKKYKENNGMASHAHSYFFCCYYCLLFLPVTYRMSHSDSQNSPMSVFLMVHPWATETYYNVN